MKNIKKKKKENKNLKKKSEFENWNYVWFFLGRRMIIINNNKWIINYNHD